MDNTTLKIRDIRKMLDNKEISSVELTKEYLNRIKNIDAKLESYITVTEDKALNQAEQAQKIIDSGNAKDLTGIPLAIKDNICTKNIRTTCASKMLENFVPIYDAFVISKLKEKGMIILSCSRDILVISFLNSLIRNWKNTASM
mgnify:CR=1 FL=1